MKLLVPIMVIAITFGMLSELALSSLAASGRSGIRDDGCNGTCTSPTAADSTDAALLQSWKAEVRSRRSASLETGIGRRAWGSACIPQGATLTETITLTDTLAIFFPTYEKTQQFYFGDLMFGNWKQGVLDPLWGLAMTPQETRSTLPWSLARQAVMDKKPLALSFQTDGALVITADESPVWSTGVIKECSNGGCVLYADSGTCNLQILNTSWEGEVGKCYKGNPEEPMEAKDVRPVWSLLKGIGDGIYCTRREDLMCSCEGGSDQRRWMCDPASDSSKMGYACRNKVEGGDRPLGSQRRQRVLQTGKPLTGLKQPVFGSMLSTDFKSFKVAMNLSCKTADTWHDSRNPCVNFNAQASAAFPWNETYIFKEPFVLGQALPGASLNQDIQTMEYSFTHSEGKDCTDCDDHVEHVMQVGRAPSVKHHNYWLPKAKGLPVIVSLGPSSSVELCVDTAGPVACDEDAANDGFRVNQGSYPDRFTISVDKQGRRVCARRTDTGTGWAMNLQIQCFTEPTVVVIGESPTDNTKCVSVEDDLSCDADAGHVSKRINDDALATDIFEITVTEDQKVCARRTNSEGGWGMNLIIACNPKGSDLGVLYTWDTYDADVPYFPVKGSSFICNASVAQRPTPENMKTRFASGALVQAPKGISGKGVELHQWIGQPSTAIHDGYGTSTPQPGISLIFFETQEGVPLEAHTGHDFFGSIQATFSQTPDEHSKEVLRTEFQPDCRDQKKCSRAGIVTFRNLDKLRDFDSYMTDNFSAQPMYAGQKEAHWRLVWIIDHDYASSFSIQNLESGLFLGSDGFKENSDFTEKKESWLLVKDTSANTAFWNVRLMKGRPPNPLKTDLYLCMVSKGQVKVTTLDECPLRSSWWLIEKLPFPEQCMSTAAELQYLNHRFGITGWFDSPFGSVFDPTPEGVQFLWDETLKATDHGSRGPNKTSPSDDEFEPDEPWEPEWHDDAGIVASSETGLVPWQQSSDMLGEGGWGLNCNGKKLFSTGNMKIKYDCCFNTHPEEKWYLSMISGLKASVNMDVPPVQISGSLGVRGWLSCDDWGPDSDTGRSASNCKCDRVEVFGCIDFALNPLIWLVPYIMPIPLVADVLVDLLKKWSLIEGSLCMGASEIRSEGLLLRNFGSFWLSFNIPLLVVDTSFEFYAKLTKDLGIGPSTGLLLEYYKLQPINFAINMQIQILWWKVKKNLVSRDISGEVCLWSSLGLGVCDETVLIDEQTTTSTSSTTTTTTTTLPTCIDRGDERITLRNEFVKKGYARLIPMDDGNLVLWDYNMTYAMWSTFEDDQGTRSTLPWTTAMSAPLFDNKKPGNSMELAFTSEGKLVLFSVGDGQEVPVWSTPPLCEDSQECSFRLMESCNLIVVKNSCSEPDPEDMDDKEHTILWRLFEVVKGWAGLPWINDFCTRKAGGHNACDWYHPSSSCQNKSGIFELQ